MSNLSIAGLFWLLLLSILALVCFFWLVYFTLAVSKSDWRHRLYGLLRRKKQNRRDEEQTEWKVYRVINLNSIWFSLKELGGEVIANGFMTLIAAVPLAFLGRCVEALLPAFKAEIQLVIGGVLGFLFLALMSLPLGLLAMGLGFFGLGSILLFQVIDWDSPLTPLALVKLCGLAGLVVFGGLWSYWCWISLREQWKRQALYRYARSAEESRAGNT